MIRTVHSNLLHIGNALDARDLRVLYDTGIRAVIDLAINEPPAQLGREIVYCRFPVNDGDGNSDALITMAIHTIVSLIRHEIPTLVACSAGMSPSAEHRDRFDRVTDPAPLTPSPIR